MGLKEKLMQISSADYFMEISLFFHYVSGSFYNNCLLISMDNMQMGDKTFNYWCSFLKCTYATELMLKERMSAIFE